MKQFFALAISCLAVAAVAQPKAQVNAVSGMPNHAQLGAPVMHFNSQSPARMMQVNNRLTRPMNLNDVKPMQKAPAGSADGALYRPSSHSLKASLFYKEDADAWGYSYVTPMLFSQAYKGTYQKVAGNSWTIGENDSAVDNADLDDQRNYDMGLAGMGVGGFYTPKIWSKRGASYFYGSDDPEGGFDYSVNYKGDASSSIAVGAYQLYGDMKLYWGYTNTLAYGARDYENADGKHAQSNSLLVEYGDLGGGYVLQYLELPIITHEEDTPYFENGGEVTITLIDYNEETDEQVEYTSVIGEDDVFFDGSGNALIHASFTETDENGFETEIEPVLNGSVTLLMTGFMQEGVNIGFRMCWDNTADEDSRSGGDFGPTHSYFDMWVDGELQLTDEGKVAWYYTDCTEAVISMVGYFNALCEYGTGEKVMNGTVPVEGGYAVSMIDDATGDAYNDFDLASSFSFEEVEVIEAPEWVTSFEYDDSYYEDYSVIAYFFGADALPAGVTGREGDVVLCSNGEVTMTIHLTQGTVGISQIQNDAVKNNVYNLQGVKVAGDLQSGLYIQNGKKIVKK